MEKRCELYTDHKNLEYIFTKLDLSLRQMRWLELFEDCDLRIMEIEVDSTILLDTWQGQVEDKKI
jgi:hypothetical protein